MIIRTLAFALLCTLLLPLAADAKTKPNITCEVHASKSVVLPGESVTISWTSSHSFITYGPDGAKVTSSGEMTVTPTKKTIYKFKFVGIGGNVKCGARVRIAGEQVPD